MDPIKVKIRNYQSIEELDFEVHGFTCITGKTNVGKSSIMRSISGALLNKPVTNLVRHGAKSCSVQVQSSSWGLLWEKAEKGLNRYTLDGKTERLENVGQRQPEPISEMGFGSVKIGDRNLYPWYASQWTPVFLLDESGPAVTQFVSEISGLDVLQNAISIGLKEKKKSLEESKFASIEAARIRDKLDKLEDLDDLVEMASELENQANSIREYKESLQSRKSFLAEIESSANSIMKFDGVNTVKIPDDIAGDILKTVLRMHARWVSLENAAKAVIELKGPVICLPDAPEKCHEMWAKAKKYGGVESLKKSVEILDQVEKVKIPDATFQSQVDSIKSAKSIESKISKAKKSVEALESGVNIPDDLGLETEVARISRAKSILTEIIGVQSDVSRLNIDSNRIEKEFKSVSEELSQIPSCPTCNRPLLQDHQHA